MKSKEEVIYDYWMAEYHHNNRKRMERQIEKLEREKMSRPERTIGIVNEDGQLEVVVAKPISDNIKRLPEIALVLCGVGFLLAQLEKHMGLWL